MNSTDEKVEVETYSHVTDATGENNQLSELDNGEIAKEAIGGTTKNLPRHYYRSFNFMGTMLAVYFGYMAGIFSFICPTNILSTINEDIGPDPNYAWFAIVVRASRYPRDDYRRLTKECSGT